VQANRGRDLLREFVDRAEMNARHTARGDPAVVLAASVPSATTRLSFRFRAKPIVWRTRDRVSGFDSRRPAGGLSNPG
jgi:hypothetical protein